VVAAARLAAVLLAGPAAAQGITLIQPIDCTLGSDCYIQNYVDADPGPGVLDAGCGRLTYDGHDGTDFALPTTADLGRGVAVLAAAAGTVRGIRDGEPDVAQGTPGAPDVSGRECGNGVAITHPGGWETQYCHMAQGSIAVQPGDTVVAGSVLGRVGLSGDTEFPHLHFTLRQGDAEIDPFDPDGVPVCGAPDPGALWPLDYAGAEVTAAGWASAVPDYAEVRAGTAAEVLASDSPALVVWALMAGGEAGDEVRITVTGPGGEVIAYSDAVPRDQALFYRAAGRRTPAGGWPAGDYAGEVALIRDGAVIARRAVAMRLD